MAPLNKGNTGGERITFQGRTLVHLFEIVLRGEKLAPLGRIMAPLQKGAPEVKKWLPQRSSGVGVKADCLKKDLGL